MSGRDESFLREVGLALRALREERAMTQEEVATRAGFTAKYLSECERGLRDLPLTSLRAIVEDGLACSMRDLPPPPTPGVEPMRPLPVPPPSGIPRPMLLLVRDVAALPERERRGVLGIIRRAVLLARHRPPPA